MSTEVEDKPVQTETAKPAATGSAAFAAARETLRAQSTDKGTVAETATPADDTSTETPAEETAKVTDQPTEITEDTEHAILSKEDLAALPPKQRQNAEKWQAKLTQESQRLSAERKTLEQWKAQQSEAEKPKPVQDTTATIATRFTKAIQALPEELRPLFQPALEALGQEVLGEIQPIAQAQQELISKAVASETQGEVKAFESKHPDYQKHEPAMLDWMQKFQPMAGVSTADYMEAAYSAVTANLKKVEQVKETVKQINRSVGSLEPNTPGVPEGRVEQTMPANWNNMTDKERMRAAYSAASKGIVWKK